MGLIFHYTGTFANNLLKRYSEEDKQDADFWFTRLQNEVLNYLFMDKERDTGRYRPRKIEFSHKNTERIFGHLYPVRVAILDTGINLSNAALNVLDPNDDRIRECLSFFDSKGNNNNDEGQPLMIKETAPGYKDDDGHGTHAAALILQVAPTAELYVARVFQSKQESASDIDNAKIHERIVRVWIHFIEVCL